MTKKTYRNLFIALILLILAVICSFYILSYNKISALYKDSITDNTLEGKKIFLENTVNNLIMQIDMEQQQSVLWAEQSVAELDSTLNFARESMSQEEYIEYVKEIAGSNMENMVIPWTVVVWNNEDQTIVYDPEKLWNETGAISAAALSDQMVSYREQEYKNLTIFFGISTEDFDEMVKQKIADQIHHMKFDYDSYIWVNEVINYEGGDNYAIRRIHPNLIETEGMYLSTKMTDIMGDLPYLEELEGINEHGELFYTYNFQKLDSDQISEKLSYAKLYEKYDWIIAMGIHLDDIQEQIATTSHESREIMNHLIYLLGGLLVLIISSTIIIITIMQQLYVKHTTKNLEMSIQKDALTGSLNRRGGNTLLNEAFELYKKKGHDHTVMLLDVDEFKKVNDTYGHDAGDEVLIQLVKTIQDRIRVEDKLIRWGGDEFVLLFPFLNDQESLQVADKIIQSVTSESIISGDQEIKITLSIGAACFRKEDTDYMDAIKRADKAMYQSKKMGRNRAAVY